MSPPFVASKPLFKNKFFGALLKKLGAFPVQRGKGDVGAIKSAIGILQRNHVMLIFPEGRRMRNGQRAQHAKGGAAMLSVRTGVPVIPVYISGEYKWMHKITITFGEPITFDKYAGKKLSSEENQKLGDEILNKIYSLDNAD